MELVTGATGYVGGRLIDRLVGGRAATFARWRGGPSAWSRGRASRSSRGDLFDAAASLEAALEGVRHRLLPRALDGGRHERRWRLREPRPHARRATSPARRAAAGVERVVYLGGLVPEGGPRSPHLASRLEVEEILLDALPESTALRASIVIGAQLVVLPAAGAPGGAPAGAAVPGWRDNRTQPIDERDAIEYLARTPADAGRRRTELDIVGPDVVTYGQMIERIAEAMGVGRMPLHGRREPDPGGQRRGLRGHRAAARARPAADGEPRIRSAAAQRDEARRRCTGCGRGASTAPWTMHSPNGRDGGAGSPMKMEQTIEIDAPPERGPRGGDGPRAARGLGDDPPPPGGEAPKRLAQGIEARPVA